MQLDVGSEPYLSTSQVLCLLIIHISIKICSNIGRGFFLECNHFFSSVHLYTFYIVVNF